MNKQNKKLTPKERKAEKIVKREQIKKEYTTIRISKETRSKLHKVAHKNEFTSIEQTLLYLMNKE